ncbi:hypothetical protein ACFQS1_33075 [Paractinoplanes rhizophilus]|uniref:GNAT family N-acetyltransferase n=1 Tax=Paractinoplanes rhizophilus TaxID=1416877 RepID=A0ABW2I1S5_9ACTN
MSYDLDESTVRQAVATALALHADRPGRFLALAVAPASPLADVARTVERQVFEESFGNDTTTMAGEYTRYENDSLFFLVLDRRTGLPAGAGRVIDGGGKTLDDAPARIGTDLSVIVARHGLANGRIWDFATLAVLPAYRGGKSGLAVSSLLYRTFLNAGRLAGVRHVVALLDQRAHRNLKLLGVEFAPMAGSAPFEYLGSPATEALHVPFPELIPSIARQADRLRRLGRPFRGGIRARGLRRLIVRRVAARIAHQVSSGDGLDERIALPGLDRRRLVRQL